MIYADNNATTACLPEVAAIVQQCLIEDYANASSKHYIAGRHAATLLDTSRQQLATTLNAEIDEVHFTSGATEALNQAIFGVAERMLSERPHIIVSSTEHPAVLEPIKRCQRAGANVSYIDVDEHGIINHSHLDQLLTDPEKGQCCLVAVMLANNETGIINDIPKISAAAHTHGAFMLCDVTAALGKISVNIKALACDFAACSAHKAYGPKGCGVFYKKRGLAIDPLIYGGMQEHQMRSGTENIPAIAGFARACAWLDEHRETHVTHLAHLHTQLESQLLKSIDGLQIHGSHVRRTPGCCMLTLPGLQKGWLSQLRSVAASSGSSCSSGTGKASHVLLQMGISETDAANSIRISLGHFNTEADIAVIAKELAAGVQRLRL